MRWLTIAVTAMIVVTVQTTLAPRLAIDGAWPDLVLIIAVFLGLHVRNLDGVAAAFVLGLLADLQSCERLGMLALIYGLIAWGVYLCSDWFFRRHVLTHVAMTFVAGVLAHGTLMLYYTAVAGTAGSHGGRLVLMIALYSAVCAPPIHALGLRLAPWLGLDTPRYTHARFSRSVS